MQNFSSGSLNWYTITTILCYLLTFLRLSEKQVYFWWQCCPLTEFCRHHLKNCIPGATKPGNVFIRHNMQKSVLIFLGVKTRLTPVKNSRFLGVKMNYAREKTEKTLQKWAWKSLFPLKILANHTRENHFLNTWKISHITPVKRKTRPWKKTTKFLWKYLSRMG